MLSIEIAPGQIYLFQETSKADSTAKKMQETVVNELKQANECFKKEIKTSTKSHGHCATQMIKVEKELYQTSAEKACLADELQSVKTAHEELIQTQYEYCMQMQAMQVSLTYVPKANFSIVSCKYQFNNFI